MFKFTIRDVLWLMVVAGFAVGLWLERREVKRMADLWERRYANVLIELGEEDLTIAEEGDGMYSVYPIKGDPPQAIGHSPYFESGRPDYVGATKVPATGP
jgi:hypothetical protein